MHPLLRQREIFSGYLSGFLVIGLMIAFAVGVSTHLRWTEVFALSFPLTVMLAVVCLSAWYVSRSYDLKTTPDWRLALTFLLAAMCASTVVMAFGHVWIWVLNHLIAGIRERFRPAIPVLAAMCSLVYLLAIILHYLLVAIESSQKAEILSREAEIKALKAQVNPHFLFNSLNSISALTSIDPPKARQMCIALSDFLRSSLRLGERPSISLSEELALTKSYLDVERVRFGSRLRIRQTIEEACAGCDVPPLLVQPLVENAIKHGIATLSEGGEIALTGERWDDQLRVTVENPFDPDAPPALKTGFGLTGVRNRIRARYGSAARLEIEIQPGLYRAVLLLPWSCNDKLCNDDR
jgi:two-component system, LytTR family, sensor histidine kinase AlgZ